MRGNPKVVDLIEVIEFQNEAAIAEAKQEAVSIGLQHKATGQFSSGAHLLDLIELGERVFDRRLAEALSDLHHVVNGDPGDGGEMCDAIATTMGKLPEALITATGVRELAESQSFGVAKVVQERKADMTITLRRALGHFRSGA